MARDKFETMILYEDDTKKKSGKKFPLHPHTFMILLLTLLTTVTIILTAKTMFDIEKLNKRFALAEERANILEARLNELNRTNLLLHGGHSENTQNIQSKQTESESVTSQLLRNTRKMNDTFHRAFTSFQLKTSKLEADDNKTQLKVDAINQTIQSIILEFNENFQGLHDFDSDTKTALKNLSQAKDEIMDQIVRINNQTRQDSDNFSEELMNFKLNVSALTQLIKIADAKQANITNHTNKIFTDLINSTSSNNQRIIDLQGSQTQLQNHSEVFVSEINSIKGNVQIMTANIEEVQQKQLAIQGENNQTHQVLLNTTTLNRGKIESSQAEIQNNTEHLTSAVSNIRSELANQTNLFQQTQQRDKSQLRQEMDVIIQDLRNHSSTYNQSINVLEDKLAESRRDAEEYRRANNVSTLQDQVSFLERDICGRTGLISKNECIRLPYYNGPGVNFTVAAKVCANLGGRLAEIENNQMANRIANMVARRWKANVRTMEVWLNSRYQNGEVRLNNGSISRVTSWYPGYPKTDPTRTYMNLVITAVGNPSNSGNNAGLYNNYLGNTYPNPLCSIPLNWP